MSTRAQIQWLADGHRLHLQDGPIDLIVEAFGAAAEVEAAYRTACERFATILDELCGELPFLRTALSGVVQNANREDGPHPRGAVAQRMTAATLPYAAQHFITPMAAVAGAVADEILTTMTTAQLSRAYVNDGGDIALALPVIDGVAEPSHLRHLLEQFEIVDAARKENREIIALCHGGPIAVPSDFAFMLEHTDVEGFVGASSMERLPVEIAIESTTKAFKALPVKGRRVPKSP